MTAPTTETVQYRICQRCKLRKAQGEYMGRGPLWLHPDLCRGCEYIAQRDPAKDAISQTANALKHLRQAEVDITWPYERMAFFAGPLPLGAVAYGMADTGIGKTTFVLDLVRRLVTGEYTRVDGSKSREEPVGVTVMPLETSPEEFRIAMACIVTGIPHGMYYRLKSRWEREQDTLAKADLDRIDAALIMIGSDPVWRAHLDVMVPETVTTGDVERAFASAAHRGHKLVIIDHIDQVGEEYNAESGRSMGGMDAVKKVNDAILQYARFYRVAVLAMSQVNASIKGDGTNPLTRFRKPELHHLMYHSFKKKNAAQIFGLYRPLRVGLSREDFILAREGVLDPLEVLEPGRMGITLPKLRHNGEYEGKCLELYYSCGALRDVTDNEIAEDLTLKAGSPALVHTSFVGRDGPRTNGKKAAEGVAGRDRQSKD